MPRRLLYGGLVAALILAGGTGWLLRRQNQAEQIFEPPSPILEPAPLCPWREPEFDLQRFFPGATRWQTETRILSGQRVELAGRLGRQPYAEELSIQLHRIFHHAEEVGRILTRRVSGEHGSIELVLAVAPDGAVRGLRVQRWREPESVRKVLASPAWQEAFVGKRADDAFRPGEDLPSVPAEARKSAIAIAEGARSLLVLGDCAERASSVASPHHPRP